MVDKEKNQKRDKAAPKPEVGESRTRQAGRYIDRQSVGSAHQHSVGLRRRKKNQKWGKAAPGRQADT